MKIVDIKKLIQEATLKDFSHLSHVEATRKYYMFEVHFPAINNLLTVLSDLEETNEDNRH